MTISKNKLWVITITLLYITLLPVSVIKHEPWFDEAQAWLLARDSNLYSLLFRYIRYEGSPGLWHMLLILPAKLQLPYISLNILSAIFAMAGTFLFVRYSPFPAYIKALYPFSYFAFYQYAVIARSYVLLPPLLFLTAIIYSKKKSHPFKFVLLLSLLANISLHGLIIAGSLFVIYLMEMFKVYGKLGKSLLVKHLTASCVFCLAMLLLVYQMVPTPDLISLAAFRFDRDMFFPRGVSMLSDSLATNLIIPTNSNKVFMCITYIFTSVAIVISFMWFGLKRKLSVFMIPFTGLCLLFTIIYANLWHQGTIFYLWLFVMWLSFEGSENIKLRFVRYVKAAATISIAFVLSIQAYWSYNTFRYDYSNNYSGSKDLAYYIKSNNLQSKSIYINNFYPISILPYFNENIFCNYNNAQKPCFWFWSKKNNMYREPFNLYKSYNPDYIIYTVKYFGTAAAAEKEMLPELPDYKLVRIFKGSIYWKDTIFEADSYALLEKASR